MPGIKDDIQTVLNTNVANSYYAEVNSIKMNGTYAHVKGGW